jgi:hypothetical protein
LVLYFLPVYISFFLSYRYISFYLSYRYTWSFLSYRYIFLSFFLTDEDADDNDAYDEEDDFSGETKMQKLRLGLGYGVWLVRVGVMGLVRIHIRVKDQVWVRV